MDFYTILEHEEGEAINPYAYKSNDEWFEGTVSVDFLNQHFGKYSTADEMINATNSEGLKLYFKWLRDEGILN